MIPSASATMMSPGWTLMPPQAMGTLTSPGPSLWGPPGVDPVAYTGRSISRRASTSRTGPVDHQPAQLLLILGIGEHDLPHEGAGGILVIGQHDDVSRLGHIQGLMEKQVVPCPRLDGQGRAPP